MDQRGGDRGIDAARQSHQHAAVAADARESPRAWSRRNAAVVQSPALAADLEHEVAEHLHAAGRMRDLGMELDAAEQAVAGANRGIRRIAAMRDRLERRRYRLDAVAVAHPHRMLAAASPSNSTSRWSITSVAGPYSRAASPRYARPGVARSRTSRSRFPAPGIQRNTSAAMSGASVS